MSSNDQASKGDAKRIREQKRLQKEREKAEKQALAAVARGMKKENWMTYMSVFIDNAIATDKGGTEVMTTLQLQGMRCEAVEQPFPNTISFVREEMVADDGIVRKSKIQEEAVLLVVQAELIASHIQDRSLVKYVSRTAAVLAGGVMWKITLLVMGFDKMMKSKRKGVITRLAWETGLVELQLESSVTTYTIKDAAALVDNIRMFCKALGERPHKLRQSKDLFIGSTKESMFVDREGGGYLQVFTAQLQDIRSVNEAIASALSQKYPSPVILRKYIARVGEDTAVEEISDIQVRRGVGVLANVRRVGPEAAKRIVMYYTSRNAYQQIA